jgi:hypothetical protein
MTSALLCSAATLSSAGSSSGLAESLPTGLCFPGPAFADMLVPDPLSLCDGHHPEAGQAVAPRPDIHLIEPAINGSNPRQNDHSPFFMNSF